MSPDLLRSTNGSPQPHRIQLTVVPRQTSCACRRCGAKRTPHERPSKTRPTSTRPRTRRTVDRTPATHRALGIWQREAADRLGFARVTGQEVLCALIEHLLSDPSFRPHHPQHPRPEVTRELRTRASTDLLLAVPSSMTLPKLPRWMAWRVLASPSWQKRSVPVAASKEYAPSAPHDEYITGTERCGEKRKLARACGSDQHLLGGAAGNRTRRINQRELRKRGI
ncbi:MAG: hypothetical protein QOH34_3124 [Mycobacterium sp.]|jgi:hypothetical protein|nr:hypothetical protein [Mycobacterium sp.]